MSTLQSLLQDTVAAEVETFKKNLVTYAVTSMTEFLCDGGFQEAVRSELKSALELFREQISAAGSSSGNFTQALGLSGTTVDVDVEARDA